MQTQTPNTQTQPANTAKKITQAHYAETHMYTHKITRVRMTLTSKGYLLDKLVPFCTKQKTFLKKPHTNMCYHGSR